jgi:hypothetical protein
MFVKIMHYFHIIKKIIKDVPLDLMKSKWGLRYNTHIHITFGSVDDLEHSFKCDFKSSSWHWQFKRLLKRGSLFCKKYIDFVKLKH